MDIGLLDGVGWPSSTNLEGKALSLPGELKLQESQEGFGPHCTYKVLKHYIRQNRVYSITNTAYYIPFGQNCFHLHLQHKLMMDWSLSSAALPD